MLLLDEPLGALDLKLRQEMQIELKRIQREVGITFVYVTHDQEEALTMSDRIAVFNHGRIEQIGTPAEVYEHPATEFVAGFVGVSNMLEREVDGRRRGSRCARRRSGCSRAPSSTKPARTWRADDPRGGLRRGWSRGTSSTSTRGGELTVVRQNLETTSAQSARGERQDGAARMETPSTRSAVEPQQEEGQE